MKSGSNSPRLQSQSSKFPGLFITTQNKQTIKESNFEDALFWRTGGRDEGVSRGRGRAAFEGHPPAAHASVCGTARCRIQYGGGSVKTIIPLRPPEVHRDPRAMIATISQICLFCSPPFSRGQLVDALALYLYPLSPAGGVLCVDPALHSHPGEIHRYRERPQKPKTWTENSTVHLDSQRGNAGCGIVPGNSRPVGSPDLPNLQDGAVK